VLSRRLDYFLGSIGFPDYARVNRRPGLVRSLPRGRRDGGREQCSALVKALRQQVTGIDADRAGDDRRRKSAGRYIAVGPSHGLPQALQLDGRGPERRSSRLEPAVA
jgi:hypothetical protein